MSEHVALKLTPVAGPRALRRPTAIDLVFAALTLLGAFYAWQRFHSYMDIYEQVILGGTAISVVVFAWHWKAMRWFLPLCAALALGATALYQGDLARAQSSFGLKYLLASQSAVMWMCVLCLLSTVVYWAALLRRSATLEFVASSLAWGTAGAALVSKLVRWYESYLIGVDVGHIPVSNLYEVFILFVLVTTLMYLYYEGRFQTRKLGAFVMLVVSAAVGFIVWYAFSRQAHEIQPLIPALQSWWMKIHVPANFVGYGAFALAAMLGVAWLLAEPKPQTPARRRTLFATAAALFALFAAFQFFAGDWYPDGGSGIGFIAKAGYSAALLCVVAGCRGKLAPYLPAPAVIDEVAYRAVALGFLFFTIATILGAMWAADAWGGYWSWDPKETWALIVWLNYAAWLHIRLVKGWRGEVLAWWSVIGLYITTFAFLGVNMFLSGLHSYGNL